MLISALLNRSHCVFAEEKAEGDSEDEDEEDEDQITEVRFVPEDATACESHYIEEIKS